MIYQSSRDYLTGEVLLHFDGYEPSSSEILNYLKCNYSFSGDPIITVDSLPSNFKGFDNPGQITVYLNPCF